MTTTRLQIKKPLSDGYIPKNTLVLIVLKLDHCAALTVTLTAHALPRARSRVAIQANLFEKNYHKLTHLTWYLINIVNYGLYLPHSDLNRRLKDFKMTEFVLTTRQRRMEFCTSRQKEGGMRKWRALYTRVSTNHTAGFLVLRFPSVWSHKHTTPSGGGFHTRDFSRRLLIFFFCEIKRMGAQKI